MSETLDRVQQSSLEVPLELSNEQDFFRASIEGMRATQAGDRIIVATMSFEPDEPIVKEVITEIIAASKRRVETLVVVDAYTFMIDSTSTSIGPLLLPTHLRQAAFQRRRSALDELAAMPYVRVVVINQPDHYGSHPFKDRSHLKGLIINDTTSIVGPNLHETDRIDAAVSFTDSHMTDQIADMYWSIADEGTTKVLGTTDITLALDLNTDIMIDVGVAGQSAIYERTTDILRQAKDWALFTSQFVPSKDIAHALLDAYDNNVDVDVFYNHVSKWGPIGGLAQKFVLMAQMLDMPAAFKDGMLPPEARRMHTKSAANEGEAGIGTHNSAKTGVRNGTAEIMLFRRSPVFANALRKLVRTSLLSDTNTITTSAH